MAQKGEQRLGRSLVEIDHLGPNQLGLGMIKMRGKSDDADVVVEGNGSKFPVNY